MCVLCYCTQRLLLTSDFVDQLLDPNNAVIAKIKQCRPARYPGLGDVFYELEFLRSAGQGVVVRALHSSFSNN